MQTRTVIRRSWGRAAAATELGPTSGGGGSRRQPSGGWRRSGVLAAAADECEGDQRRRHRGSRSGRITGPRSPVDDQQRQIQRRGSGGGEQRRQRRRLRCGAGGEYRAAAAVPADNLDRAGARGDSRSTGVADEQLSRRVAVDVDDGSGRRRRWWWRRIFGDGATAGIFGISDEMSLQGLGGEPLWNERKTDQKKEGVIYGVVVVGDDKRRENRREDDMRQGDGREDDRRREERLVQTRRRRWWEAKALGSMGDVGGGPEATTSLC
ncbi:hypothetical protein Syun_019490 [Stephania yunnanensis]|uniref:Uncharacterized protein n=1 Tax=Stephania yunnanensis TaxID=152371 RepID=A0AAP0IU92_9MAGN